MITDPVERAAAIEALKHAGYLSTYLERNIIEGISPQDHCKIISKLDDIEFHLHISLNGVL